jgi:hypothetical protein
MRKHRRGEAAFAALILLGLTASCGRAQGLFVVPDVLQDGNAEVLSARRTDTPPSKTPRTLPQ